MKKSVNSVSRTFAETSSSNKTTATAVDRSLPPALPPPSGKTNAANQPARSNASTNQNLLEDLFGINEPSAPPSGLSNSAQGY